MDVDPKAVRMARMESGLSLAQVADKRVSRTAIHLVEAGKMKPSLQTLQLIADRTNKPLSFFMSNEPAEPVSSGITDLERAAAQNDHDRVIALGMQLLAERNEVPDEALIRYQVGRAHLQRAEAREALRHLEAALAGFERVGDELGRVECLDQIACAYLRLDDPRQQPAAEEALRRCRELRPVPKYLESRILGNLALMQAHARRWKQAVYFYEECLKAGSDVKNLRHRALVYNGLSLASQRLGNLSAATSYAHKAIALYSLESDIASIALAENNLADILLRSGHLDDAERHAASALRLCEEQGIRQLALTYGLLTLGEIHQQRREPDAEAILKRAIAAAEEEEQQVPIATAHQLLGRIAAADGRTGQAAQEFETAVSLLEKLDMPERLRDCLVEYAACVESTGAPSAHLWKRAAYIGSGIQMPAVEPAAPAESQTAG